MTSLKQFAAWFALTCWALCAPCVGGQEAPGKVEITQVDISRFPEVTVFFKLTGLDGRGIRDLRSENVALFEDGQPTRISRFHGMGSFQVMTALLVDCSGSMADRVSGGGTKLDAAKAACRTFLSVSRPEDANTLIQFNTTVTTVKPFGTGAISLLRLKPRFFRRRLRKAACDPWRT